jgi:hypothetical protein
VKRRGNPESLPLLFALWIASLGSRSLRFRISKMKGREAQSSARARTHAEESFAEAAMI